MFRSEYPEVVRVVAPIVGSIGDAESVTHDAFAKAYARWSRLGTYDKPGAWVRRVAIRDAVRVAERNRRPLPVPAADTDATASLVDRLDLHAALLRLPARQRACVVLHHLADWPVTDVASAIGCREATVRVHLHRGRLALAALLTPTAQESVDGC